jgi:putative acetyltransferase
LDFRHLILNFEFTMPQIIPYTDNHASAFKAINVEWLEKYNLLESHDIEMLDDPRSTIIAGGGVIYLAEDNDIVIGSAALIHEHHGVYELAKMTVVPAWRGKGISKLLLEKCLDTARTLQAKKVILFSNDQLQTAIALYLQYGFTHIPVTDSPFATANVKMELNL